MHGVNDVRQAEMHTAESVVPECSAPEIEMPVEKFKICAFHVLVK
jgi:hypothetical protein